MVYTVNDVKEQMLKFIKLSFITELWNLVARNVQKVKSKERIRHHEVLYRTVDEKTWWGLIKKRERRSYQKTEQDIRLNLYHEKWTYRLNIPREMQDIRLAPVVFFIHPICFDDFLALHTTPSLIPIQFLTLSFQISYLFFCNRCFYFSIWNSKHENVV